MPRNDSLTRPGNRFKPCPVVVGLLALCFSGPAFAEGEPFKEFLAAYEQARKPLLSASETFEAVGEFDSSNTSAKYDYRSEISLDKRGESVCIHYIFEQPEMMDNEESERVYCITPDYVFFTKKFPQSSRHQVVYANPDPPGSRDRAYRQAKVEHFVYAAHRVTGIDILALLRAPNTRILSVQPVKDHLIEVRYQFIELDLDESRSGTTGLFVLDESRSHALVHHEEARTLASGATITDRVDVEYGDWDDGMIFPRRVRYTGRREKSGELQLESIREMRFSEVRFGDVEESNFLPSSFDLPDSIIQTAATTESENWNIPVLMALCAVILLGGLYSAWQARRSAAPAD